MVFNTNVVKATLIFCNIVLVVVSKGYPNNSYYGNRISEINITNVMNISNLISLPIKLNINEEINIELMQTESENKDNKFSLDGNNISASSHQKNNILQNETTRNNSENNSSSKYQKIQEYQSPNITMHYNENSINNMTRQNQTQTQNKTTCCLVIYPPKCEINQCIIQRKKMCWNVCTEEIVILEAPGFPKDKFPKALIPFDWKNGQFPENITVYLKQANVTGIDNATSSDVYQQHLSSQYQLPTYYWSQAPYPYVVPQSLPSQQYQNYINPNSIYNNVPYQIGYPYYSSYISQPRPPLYWCSGPYCPVLMNPYY